MSKIIAFRPILLVLLAVLLSTSGCHRQPPLPVPAAADVEAPPPVTRHTALRQVDVDDLPLLFDDGDPDSLIRALRHSRRWLAGRRDRTFDFGPRQIAASELVSAYDRLLGWLTAGVSAERLTAEVAYAFDVLESIGGRDGEMLVTGYYEPVIDGSLRRGDGYEVPVYGPPPGTMRIDLAPFADDLAGRKIVGRFQQGRFVPFPTRGEMRRGAPAGSRVIAWARDPVDLFFVEVQGSGALRLPDGGELRIGYAAANGRPYRSIGRLLIDEGKIERHKVSMQSIREYLRQHPEELTRVLDHNDSVVFFRQLDGPPLGSLGLPVTAGRSVATDHALFPPGALGFLITEVPGMGPDGSTVSEGTLSRFVVNQDRGGAIRGPGRLDFFWGRGDEAALRAGLMKQPGRLFFLVPKDETETPQDEDPRAVS